MQNFISNEMWKGAFPIFFSSGDQSDFDPENVIVEFVDSDMEDFAKAASSSAMLKENKKMPEENIYR